MLPRLLTRDDNDEFRNLGLLHPPAELAHNLLDVGFDLVVAGGHHGEAVFLYAKPTPSSMSAYKTNHNNIMATEEHAAQVLE